LKAVSRIYQLYYQKIEYVQKPIVAYLRFVAVKILCGVFRAKWQTKSEKCPFQIQVLNQNRQRTGLKMMTKRVLFSITFSNTDKNNRKTKKFKFIQDKSRIFLLF